MAGREVTSGWVGQAGGWGRGWSSSWADWGEGGEVKGQVSQAFITELMVKNLYFQREISVRGGCIYYCTWFLIKFEDDTLGKRL